MKYLLNKKADVNFPAADGKTALITAALAKTMKWFDAWKIQKAKEMPTWDGKIDPRDYTRLRNDFISTFGDATQFDEAFAPMLSLQERINLGVGKTTL